MADIKPPPPPYRRPDADKASIRTGAPTAPLGGKDAIDVDQIDRSINESLRRQVSDAIMKNPELVLSVLRGWKNTR